uniref:Bm13292, isoform a n=1 Tax=Brugia malayi TaxID=6279 RepID=A0A0J9Y0V0_BRUMA|nr:Bm13292, isoform a [Brugia malayi]
MINNPIWCYMSSCHVVVIHILNYNLAAYVKIALMLNQIKLF